MPELPDIEAYLRALSARVLGRRLLKVSLHSPFLLRSVRPPLTEIEGRTVTSLRRLGKRICLEFDHGAWAVLHLMIAGRLHWERKTPGKTLAVFEFDAGKLSLTEAGTQRRASLTLVADSKELQQLDPGGLEPLECTLEEFQCALVRENHTLKRALTDPHVISGIGNAFSDEILWQAQLSPVALTRKLSEPDLARLHEAMQQTLRLWIDCLSDDEFPEKVTAFRPQMAVHGKYGQPCPRCESKVQRIRYASNETNYCARCQTGGRLLADRALSRLLARISHES